jgi:CRISPR/Cas system-associated endoribonuclease Cas2
MMKRVGAVLNAGDDSVRIYRLCANCRAEREAMGCATVAAVPTVFVV